MTKEELVAIVAKKNCQVTLDTYNVIMVKTNHHYIFIKHDSLVNINSNTISSMIDIANQDVELGLVPLNDIENETFNKGVEL